MLLSIKYVNNRIYLPCKTLRRSENQKIRILEDKNFSQMNTLN